MCVVAVAGSSTTGKLRQRTQSTEQSTRARADRSTDLDHSGQAGRGQR